MKKLEIIIDTREQVNEHIVKHFDEKKIAHRSRKLDIGDYAVQIGDETMERRFVIERKHNLDELCGNMTADRDRFEREFLRAKAYGTKVYLIIEEATWDDVFLQNYRSRLSAKSLLGTLWSWQTRFNVTVILCPKRRTGAMIYGILAYAAREVLLYG